MACAPMVLWISQQKNEALEYRKTRQHESRTTYRTVPSVAQSESLCVSQVTSSALSSSDVLGRLPHGDTLTKACVVPPVETLPVSLHIHTATSLDRHGASPHTPPALLPTCRAVRHALVLRSPNRAIPAQSPIALLQRPSPQGSLSPRPTK